MSASSTESPPRRGAAPEDTRRRIEDTADRLFRTMGYQKTAVADIARELGMSPANVYRFFASKSAINEAIAARTLDAMRAEIDAIADGPGTAPERLRRLYSRLFELKLIHFFQERRLHDMVIAAMEESWAVVADYIAGVRRAVARIIRDGIAAGDFRPGDPDRLAALASHAMVAWNHPALIETCIARKGQTVEELRAQAAEMTDFILAALRR